MGAGGVLGERFGGSREALRGFGNLGWPLGGPLAALGGGLGSPGGSLGESWGALGTPWGDLGRLLGSCRAPGEFP